MSVIVEISAINFDPAFKIFTLYKTNTNRMHITSLPRAGLNSYAGSQIHKGDT